MPHDPKELFIMNAITREGIADDINTYISGYDDTKPHPEALKPDDERLTPEFCKEYAKELGDMCSDPDLSEEDRMEWEQNIAHNFAAKLGLYFPDDEEGEDG